MTTKTLLFSLIAGFAFVFLAAAAAPSLTRAQNPAYCPSQSAYGYYTYASASSYQEGQAVNFCLQNNTRTPTFNIQSQWRVEDSKGNIVYTAPALSSDPNSYSFGTYYGTWNQHDANGAQVKAGSYRIVYSAAANQTTASFTITKKPGHVIGYYPVANPSTYFILPGNPLSFSGRGFAPNENVSLYNGTVLASSYSADANGNLSIPNAVTISHGLENTVQTFRLEGSVSGYSKTYRVVVGGFYPNITPSSYYFAQGQQITVTGKDFAPSEPVNIVFNGVNSTITANAAGNISTVVTAPFSGGKYAITAQGAWSGAVSSRTVTVAR